MYLMKLATNDFVLKFRTEERDMMLYDVFDEFYMLIFVEFLQSVLAQSAKYQKCIESVYDS